jgi:hypothetical protein
MTVAFQAHAHPIAEEDALWRRSYPVCGPNIQVSTRVSVAAAAKILLRMDMFACPSSGLRPCPVHGR